RRRGINSESEFPVRVVGLRLTPWYIKEKREMRRCTEQEVLQDVISHMEIALVCVIVCVCVCVCVIVCVCVCVCARVVYGFVCRFITSFSKLVRLHIRCHDSPLCLNSWPYGQQGLLRSGLKENDWKPFH